jgi:hypothetical protein
MKRLTSVVTRVNEQPTRTPLFQVVQAGLNILLKPIEREGGERGYIHHPGPVIRQKICLDCPLASIDLGNGGDIWLWEIKCDVLAWVQHLANRAPNGRFGLRHSAIRIGEWIELFEVDSVGTCNCGAVAFPTMQDASLASWAF